MVEEERTQIGILKALGYGNASIVGKYLWYAILATLTGGVFGILIGEKIIPYDSNITQTLYEENGLPIYPPLPQTQTLLQSSLHLQN